LSNHLLTSGQVDRESDGRFIAEVPDLPGVLAYGSTQDEAIARAQALALRVQAGGSDLCASITLEGDLGTGKTTLVRHLLQALGVAGRIKSPTYAVVEPYSVAGAGAGAEPLAIWHFDFYRFNDPDEWEEAGFRDIFAGPGLKLVEWPDKAGRHLPAPDLRLCLETIQGEGNFEERRVSLHALTATGAALTAA
jgi:tRNA threonylcarbamoyladenosine biosynthesis protein TsaE